MTLIGTNHDVYELEGDTWFEILTDELITTTQSEPSFRSLDLDNPDWDEDDSAHEVYGDLSNSVNDCYTGCHECYDAWMSDDPS